MALLGAAQANAANAAQNRAYGWKKKMEEAGESSAFLSNAIQQRQLGTQTQQKMRSVNEEIQMISRKGNQVAATAAVRATKGGVNADSASVVALQQQFGKDAMQAIGVRDVEGQGILTFSQQQAKAIELQTQARIDSVQAGPAPDKRAQFGNILMGAAKGYMQGQSMQGGITPSTPTAPFTGGLTGVEGMSTMFEASQAGALSFTAPAFGPQMVNPLTLGGANAQLPQLPSLDLSTVSHATRLQQPLLSIKPQDGFFNPYNMDNWQFNNPFAGFRF
jgi:hypothetical protein